MLTKADTVCTTPNKSSTTSRGHFMVVSPTAIHEESPDSFGKFLPMSQDVGFSIIWGRAPSFMLSAGRMLVGLN